MNKLEGFPTGKERRQEIKGKEMASIMHELTYEESLGKNIKYNWINSPLDQEGLKEEKGVPFLRSFVDILPEPEKGLKGYIENTLNKRSGHAIGVEFGGVGSALFQGFTSGFFKQTVGITLVDYRKPKIRILDDQNDIKINHSTFKGDIFKEETYKKLKTVLKNEQVDLIIERMGGGLEFTPEAPFTVGKILQVWYKLLREGGIMIVQVPVVFNYLLSEWAREIRIHFPKKLEIEFAAGERDNTSNCSSFRLRKLRGAPEELPLLEPKKVSKIPPNRKHQN